MKQVFVKYFSQLLILITIVGAALFAYNKWRDANDERRYAYLIGTKTKYEQLTKYTAKLESNYKKQKDLIWVANKRFQEVIRKKNERIKMLSDATFLIGKHVEKQNGPDYYYQTPKGTRNYVLNELRIGGKDSPPIGYIMIRKNGTIYKRNYEFEIKVETLATKDETTGHVRVYTKAFLIEKEVSPLKKRISGYKDWSNKKYPLKITGGVALIDPTEASYRKKFYWWAPHINGGMNIYGPSSIRPMLGWSISGYGKTKNDLDWKFLQLSVDSDDKFKNIGINLAPFTYRPFGKVLSNTYIGPSVGRDSNGYSFGININLSF